LYTWWDKIPEKVLKVCNSCIWWHRKRSIYRNV